jgi:tRNA threonylcarbamoyladenosine modification (KEOPS) complex Cgi121 subunit
MEILLYVAADRQIGEALKIVGVTPETSSVAAIAEGMAKEQVIEVASALRELLKMEESEELLDRWDRKRLDQVRSVFRIGDKEIGATLRTNEELVRAVERLAIERSALLAIKK